MYAGASNKNQSALNDRLAVFFSTAEGCTRVVIYNVFMAYVW